MNRLTRAHRCISQEEQEQQQNAPEADKDAGNRDPVTFSDDLTGMEAQAAVFGAATGGPASGTAAAAAQQPGLALVDGGLAPDAASGECLSHNRRALSLFCALSARCGHRTFRDHA